MQGAALTAGHAVEQVVGRPFKFARILRVVRYVDGLQTLASTIAAALPATLQVHEKIHTQCYDA